MTATDVPADTTVDSALFTGTGALLAMQHHEGWWKGILDTNVSMDAEDLLLRQFLAVLTPEQLDGSARWIRSQQRTDGTWSNHFDGPPELSTTVEAYVALRLAGDPTEAAHMRRTRDYVVAHGGVERTRVFTRLWLALFGLWPWDDLPALPPEVILLPSWMPLNIYDFACWARQTIVPLTIVGAYRPVRPLPFDIDELRTGATRPPMQAGRTRAGQLERLDRALHKYEKRPLPFLRKHALAKAERWILDRQEADGSWGGIQPPWVYSIIALHLRGHALDSPAMKAAFEGLDRFTIHENGTRRLEACQSPVWDTAFAMLALSDAGVAGDHPSIARAAEWLLEEEIRVRGDWSVRRPNLEPGGWAFEFENDNYPDVDDTAEVVIALQRVTAPELQPRVDGAIERATNWVLGMQCRDGGWAAFDVDNTRALCRDLPFCDFGEVIDPPSADVTAHVVEMLARLDTGHHELERGVRWLWDAQEADGSWFGRWGVNYVYGTGHVLLALATAGVPRCDRRIRTAVRWLVDHQHVDGGWGEDARSYRDRRWIGRGKSTASQTAWALLGLLASADDEFDVAIERGVRYLVETQRADGTWDEPEFTGTGFPGDFFINYHLYRQVFPLMALGRYARRSYG